MLRDWLALWLMRRVHVVHLATDPACRLHRPPRPGSRLDRASRGWPCRRCMDDRLVAQIDSWLEGRA